eukprot:TRINITY_DN3579_c0_g1_i11.p1 TRINITY_DN3579_c0_g1~~TRINITY_DN3579_c0_g1_i11.p1  ORF type:complete len:224 (+),score=13.63 TRINITY_DN3579_c0_g1_i11:597-1268(+)
MDGRLSCLPIAEICLTARHPEVYEPCDDSFALVDAFHADAQFLFDLAPTICLEIGCGSGYVITSLALILSRLGRNRVQLLATDINPFAPLVTQRTLRSHSVDSFDIVRTSLCASLLDRLEGNVDVLLFNPPYVPTPSTEVGRAGISAAWAGGFKGREVLDQVLPHVGKLLSPSGCFYLLAVEENDIEELCALMKAQGLDSRSLIKRTTEEESLSVLKFSRKTM